MMRLLTLLTMIVAGLSNCTQKPVYRCGFSCEHSIPHTDGKILKLERVAVADTTIAFVFGNVMGKDSGATGVNIDKLMGVIVMAIDQRSRAVYAIDTDSIGKYHFTLPAAIYDLKVIYEAYNTLIVKNVTFGTGDMMEFDALLGGGTDSTVYMMHHDKSLRRIE